MTLRRVALIFLIACFPPCLAQNPPPLPSDVQDEVSVRLTLVEVAALDRRGRPVPGLGKEDFELLVDGDRVDIASVNPACPPPGAGASGWAEGGREPRRIVLALDYLHMNRCERRDVLEQARALVKRRNAALGDEIMVVALDGGVRIEQALTSDLPQVARTLRRMEYDVTLWAPAFGHPSEAAFFRPLLALLTGLESVPPGNSWCSTLRSVPAVRIKRSTPSPPQPISHGAPSTRCMPPASSPWIPAAAATQDQAPGSGEADTCSRLEVLPPSPGSPPPPEAA